MTTTAAIETHGDDPSDNQRDDQTWAAFSDAAPWVLDRDAITWLPLAAKLRAAAQAEVPRLTKPSRLPPGTRVLTLSLIHI